ncbi:MAG: hypothetical protein A2Y38_20140 [Spirochaetes bacterium GWB1_59_5]|nr:MAG: hypothetical protein A2Y38_20140 [Spirochaetes bacterium GWB1_59_5]
MKMRTRGEAGATDATDNATGLYPAWRIEGVHEFGYPSPLRLLFDVFPSPNLALEDGAKIEVGHYVHETSRGSMKYGNRPICIVKIINERKGTRFKAWSGIGPEACAFGPDGSIEIELPGFWSQDRCSGRRTDIDRAMYVVPFIRRNGQRARIAKAGGNSAIGYWVSHRHETRIPGARYAAPVKKFSFWLWVC